MRNVFLATVTAICTCTVCGAASAEPQILVENSSFSSTARRLQPAEEIQPAEAIPITYLKERKAAYPETGVSLGQGWNSLKDEKTQSICLSFSRGIVGGQAANIETKKIMESDSLRKEMEVSYSASAKAKFKVGGGGASVKSSFLKSSQINNSYLNLLVKGSVRNGVEFAAPTLETGAIELKERFANMTATPEDFINYCGDSFVSAIERGAELYALYQFSSSKRTANETKQVSVSVDGSYLAFSGSASTSTRNVRETANDNALYGLKYLHSSHMGLRLPFDESSISSSIASLGSALELEDSFPFRIVLTRYDALPGWNSDVLNAFGAMNREPLQSLHFKLSDLLETAEDADANAGNYNLESGPDLINAARISALLQSKIMEIERLLIYCEDEKENNIYRISDDYKTKCSTDVSTDGIFTDYHYRSIMPLKKEHFSLIPLQAQIAEYDAAISKLQQEWTKARTHITSGGIRGGGIGDPIRVTRIPINNTCSKGGRFPPCPDLAKTLDRNVKERAALGIDRPYASIAESRYRFWIEEPSKIRREQGLINGLLSQSELEMYRRDIYCQYGASSDSSACPERLLSDIALQGDYPTKIEQRVSIDISSTTSTNILDAWNDLQTKIRAQAFELSQGAPFYFELLEPTYDEIIDNDLRGFNIKSQMIVTTYEESGSDILNEENFR